MGNVPTVPSNPPGRPSTGTSGEQQPQKNGGAGGEVGAAKPPIGWNKESDDQDFILVSPQSDLSNPSQFRHRIVKNNKTPIQERKRTSKVISKEIPPRQTYIRSNTLPAPQAFYFERHIRDNNDDDECLPGNNGPGPAAAPVPRVSADAVVAGENEAGCLKKKNWIPSKHRVKEKAGQAKRMLKGCWNEHKEQMHGCIQEKHADHEQLKTSSPVVVVPEARLKQSNVDPVIEAGIPQQVVFQPYHQQDMTQLTQTCIGDVRTYLHDERNYVDRLVAADGKPNIPTPRPNAVSTNNKNLHEEDRIVTTLFDTKKVGKAVRKSSLSPVKRKKQSSSTGITTRTSISEAIQAQIDTQLQRNDKNKPKDSRTSQHQRVSSTSTESRREPLAEKKAVTNNQKETTTTRGRLSSRDGELKRRSASSLICRSKAVDHEQEQQQQQQELCTKESSKSMQSEARRVSLDMAENALDSPDTCSSGSTLFSKTPNGEKENFAQRACGRIVNDRRTSLAAYNSLTGSSVSDMLIQTYPIANAFIDPRIRYSTARYLTGNYTKLDTDPSSSCPLDSAAVDAVLTPIGKPAKPLLSEQVTTNAAFLFSPSYYAGDGAPEVIKPAPRNDSSSFTISTTESRNRLSGWCPSQQSQPVSVRVSIDEASVESDRRVRFSGSDQVFPLAKEEKDRNSQKKSSSPGELVYIPQIESKLSDLTDTTGLPNNAVRRESIMSATSNSTTHSSKVPSIPEETVVAANDDSTTTSLPSNEPSDTKSAPLSTNIEHEPSPPHSTDNSTNLPVTEYSKNSTQALQPPPKKNWSYAATGNNSMDNGVTPLRSGKSSYNATNSPFLRFNEAKNRFAGKNNTTTKVQPVKGPARSVKKISPGLVQKRVVAMEEKVRNNATTRRDTVGHQAIAPRKGLLVSSTFRTNSHSSVNPNAKQQQQSTAAFKYQPLDESKVQQTFVTRDSASNDGTGYDTDNTDDPYGQIMHSNPIDEGSSDEEAACDILQDVIAAQKTVASVVDSHDGTDYETEDDDFAALLQYQSSEMDEDDSFDEETVSTVRQQPRKIEYKLSRGSSNYSSQRPSTGSSSFASTTIAPSVATIRQNRQSLVSTSESTTLSHALKKENIAMAFRNEAHVKPNEQTHRAPPGALCLSPMQRTPMQARKWRALAAAAQEKESKRKLVGSNKGSSIGSIGRGGVVVRKSLSERSNTMHNKL